MNAISPLPLAGPPTPAPELAATIIAFEAVEKTFASRKGQVPVRALRRLDLRVARGTILGIIGRSGAGKSTLIRLINGLERVSAGKVVVDGADVTGFDEAQWRRMRRSIGMVFQHFNLLSSLTAFGNVARPLEIADLGRAEIEKRVSGLLDLVGLADKRGRYPAELSGGQKQRVGIARALASQPKVLLCDEATSALDPETTTQILELLARINRELGVTIVLNTHEMSVVKDVCHAVAVIENGRVVEDGPVFDVLTRPEHPTTASFVRGVAHVELPADIAARLERVAGQASRAILRIGFVGQHATAPVISRLTTVIGVDVNIIAGRIDSVGSRPFASLIVAVAAAEPGKSAVLASLRRLGFSAEVLGYVA